LSVCPSRLGTIPPTHSTPNHFQTDAVAFKSAGDNNDGDDGDRLTPKRVENATLDETRRSSGSTLPHHRQNDATAASPVDTDFDDDVF
jgi:hypothetical protein